MWLVEDRQHFVVACRQDKRARQDSNLRPCSEANAYQLSYGAQTTDGLPRRPDANLEHELNLRQFEVGSAI